ncbi:MAG: molybdopterin converting factor subunit 1 [Marinovum sp.]|mgnify:FL=1|nr:molybdopterin converting factor subunit 1 [Marinovum sp.]MBT7906754.1 molybdopterin converting factor subunit 1 [Marinovum sp.]MDG2230049.1 molybdopterin converting factor subunit 1 [Paracoccaceae bacterium]
MRVLYFAWLRERIGVPAEDIETAAETIEDLVLELSNRTPRYKAAFSDLSAVRCALDQNLVSFDTPLGDAREVAFFPPMTGG